VKDSETFVNEFNERCLKGLDHRLATWDYESMFTNINLSHAMQIVRENYAVIAEETSVPIDLFMEAISFFMVHCSYFTFKGEIYRQCKGLPMGVILSQVLAEISTNNAAVKTLKSLNENDVSFIKKYVDDFIGAMNPDVMQFFENELMSCIKGLPIKRTDECENGGVSFLDVFVIRDVESFKNKAIIRMRWWQKDCCAKQILNFHSLHPSSVKANVIYEYTKHALNVSSSTFYNITMKNIERTFVRSSYPPNLIRKTLWNVLNALGKTHVTSSVGEPDENFVFEDEFTARGNEKIVMKNSKNSKIIDSECNLKMLKEKGSKNDIVRYIPIPFHNQRIMNDVKGLMKKHNIGCKLAPRVVCTNRNLIFSKLKDGTPTSCVKYGTFGLKCICCPFIKYFKTNNLDVQRTVSHLMNLEISDLKAHEDNNAGHSISFTPYNLVRHRNEFDLNIAYQRLNV